MIQLLFWNIAKLTGSAGRRVLSSVRSSPRNS